MRNGWMDRMPKVSIIMPVFNGAQWVEAAIRSVMEQSYGNWNLLVMDDGSTDGTADIVDALAAEDTRIRLVKNEHNSGAAMSRNRGLDLYDGDYVAFLDGDDLWHREKLERQVELAEKTGADIVYCGYRMIGPDGEPVGRDFIVPEETDFRAMLVKSVISCSTAMLSRDVARAYRFPQGYRHEDLALWLEMLGDGCTARGIPEALADYRLTPASRSADKLRAAKGRWEIYRKMLRYPPMKSLVLLLRYGVLGLMKYRRCDVWKQR